MSIPQQLDQSLKQLLPIREWKIVRDSRRSVHILLVRKVECNGRSEHWLRIAIVSDAFSAEAGKNRHFELHLIASLPAWDG